MAEQERPPVGSVAEEAARLLDALGGWAASSGYAGGYAREEPGGYAGTDASGDAGEAADAREAAGDAGDAPGAAARHTAGEGPADPPHAGGHCEHCGAEDGVGRAVACRLCPVCQGIGLLRSVRPETVDRLADLASAIAGTLRDLADHRRTAEASTAPRNGRAAGGDGGGARHAGPRVQDIAVDDETTATP